MGHHKTVSRMVGSSVSQAHPLASSFLHVRALVVHLSIYPCEFAIIRRPREAPHNRLTADAISTWYLPHIVHFLVCFGSLLNVPVTASTRLRCLPPFEKLAFARSATADHGLCLLPSMRNQKHDAQANLILRLFSKTMGCGATVAW